MISIELNKISKSFGPVKANQNINLKAKGGEILGLLGENGAGKTTLMNILSGLYLPDYGEILINDKNDFPAGLLGKIYTKLFGNNTSGYLVEMGGGNCLPSKGCGSNTANLADMGWTGLYREANPNYIDEIKERHKDNNVEIINAAAGDVEEASDRDENLARQDCARPCCEEFSH